MASQEKSNIIPVKYVVFDRNKILLLGNTAHNEIILVDKDYQPTGLSPTGAGLIEKGKCVGESDTLEIGVGEDDQDLLNVFILGGFK